MSSLARSKRLQAVFADAKELLFTPEECRPWGDGGNEHDVGAANILYLDLASISHQGNSFPWRDWPQVAYLVRTFSPSMLALKRVVSGTAMAPAGSLAQMLQQARLIEASLADPKDRSPKLCFAHFVYMGYLDQFLRKLTQLSPVECSVWNGLRFGEISVLPHDESDHVCQLPAEGLVMDGRWWESYFLFVKKIWVCDSGLEHSLQSKKGLQAELSNKLGWSEKLSTCCIPVEYFNASRSSWCCLNSAEDLGRLETHIGRIAASDRETRDHQLR